MWVWISALEEKLGGFVDSGKQLLSGMQHVTQYAPVLSDLKKHQELRHKLYKLVGSFFGMAAVGITMNHIILEALPESWLLWMVAVYGYGYTANLIGQYMLGDWGNALCATLKEEDSASCGMHLEDQQIDDMLLYAFSEAQLSFQYLPVPHMQALVLPFASILNGMGIHSYGHHNHATDKAFWGYFLGFGVGQQAVLMSLENLLSFALTSGDVFFVKNTVRLISLVYLIHKSHYSELIDQADDEAKIDAFKPARKLQQLIAPSVKEAYKKMELGRFFSNDHLSPKRVVNLEPLEEGKLKFN